MVRTKSGQETLAGRNRQQPHAQRNNRRLLPAIILVDMENTLIELLPEDSPFLNRNHLDAEWLIYHTKYLHTRRCHSLIVMSGNCHCRKEPITAATRF